MVDGSDGGPSSPQSVTSVQMNATSSAVEPGSVAVPDTTAVGAALGLYSPMGTLVVGYGVAPVAVAPALDFAGYAATPV